MYDGYVAIGGEFLTDPRIELVNSSRVDAYVENWNKKQRQAWQNNKAGLPTAKAHAINWLEPCNVCPDVGPLFTDGADYVLPELDPAPWYDANVDGADRFFGFLGLEVVGDEGVTRTAQVHQAITAGGFISRNNFLTREITVRALAVAADDCGLAVGLDYMREAFTTALDPCLGDFLWFLNCCPDCEATGDPQNLCWPTTYAEYAGPSGCPVGTWWPSTYGEFLTGPPLPSDPIEDNEWCTWITNYAELTVGLPAFACDLRECILPNLRQFRRVRVIEGPTVVSRTEMHGGAEIAEIEFVIVAADPAHYTPLIGQQFAVEFIADGEVEDVTVPESGNPFAPLGVARRSTSPQVSSPATVWKRQMIEFWPDRVTSMSGMRADITLTAIDAATENIRVGVWDHTGKQLLGGWQIPLLPLGGSIRIDGPGRRVTTEWGGEVRANTGNVVDWSGLGAVRYPQLAAGTRYLVSVDVPKDKDADFTVELSATETES